MFIKLDTIYLLFCVVSNHRIHRVNRYLMVLYITDVPYISFLSHLRFYVRSVYCMTYSFSGRHSFYDARNMFVAFSARQELLRMHMVNLPCKHAPYLILPSDTDSYRFVILIHLIVNRDTYHITHIS